MSNFQAFIWGALAACTLMFVCWLVKFVFIAIKEDAVKEAKESLKREGWNPAKEPEKPA